MADRDVDCVGEEQRSRLSLSVQACYLTASLVAILKCAAIEISPYWALNRQKDAELVGGRMEEKRNWWEEGLRMAGANFGDVVETSSAAKQEKPVRTVHICACPFPCGFFFPGMFSLRGSVSYQQTITS